jgi:hypothetical protein
MSRSHRRPGRTRNPLRQAFARRTYVLIRVTQKGFRLEDDILPELSGRIIKSTMLRKLFQDGDLVCQSKDGVTAEDGTVCATCLHPLCRPQMRIQLLNGSCAYVIDLAVTSAQNLLDFEDEAKAEDKRLRDLEVVLTILDRGHWGEVRFARA